MKRIFRIFPILCCSLCTALYMSYSQVDDIFIVSLVMFYLGYMLNQLMEMYNDDYLDFLQFYLLGYIILNSAAYTAIICVYLSPVFILCALLAILSGYFVPIFNDWANE